MQFDWSNKRALIVAGGLEHYRSAELVHALLGLGAFEVDMNEVTVVDANGIRARLARVSKYRTACELLTTLAPELRVAVAKRRPA